MRRCALFVLALSCLGAGFGCGRNQDREKPTTVTKDAGEGKPIEAPKELKARLEATLKHVHARYLESSFSFWTIFHGILGMGLQTEIVDSETGKKVVAIDHIRLGKPLRGLKFIRLPEGLDVQIGPVPLGQGHQDQFVAEMAQWGLAADAEFMVDGKKHTFMDFARFSKGRASPNKNQELGWAIIVIAEYFGVDTPPWVNNFGEKISLEDLIREELKIDLIKAACGGTHSLFGLTWVYHRHLQKGGKTDGVWIDVKKHLDKYKKMAKDNQNPDGSYSNEYMNETGEIKDPDRRINTAGHTVEWLALYLTDKELREPWVQDAVMALCKMILDRAHTDIDTGSLYHATHGLHIYYDRVFDAPNKKGRPIVPLPPG